MAIIDDPSAYFQTTLYSGTGNTQSITNTGNSDLQPDWVWLKVRSNGTYGHALFDSVRGVNKVIASNTTSAEEDQSSDVSLSAFNSDGFTVGGYYNNVNQNGQTFTSWQWKAGTSFTNDASSTGIGTIDSTGSASNTSGFSIVSYTGTGSAGTIKHGLSTAPLITLIKSRTTSTNWNFLTYQIDGSCDELALNLSSEGKTDRSITAPTSSVFSVDTAADRNGSGVNFIAYCFAEKQGYSKFGSYVGNGNADGPMIYTGFKPAWLMIRKSSSGGDWLIYDNKRNAANLVNSRLSANETNAEGSDSNGFDFLSNGFKLRTSDSSWNASGSSFIYMAFAEEPLVASNFNAATAR